MKKLLLIIALAFACIASAQNCPPGNLNQPAKWKFLFSQCMEDTLFITYATTKQVMYLDQNGVVTTISFAQLLDSLDVPATDSSIFATRAYVDNEIDSLGALTNITYPDSSVLFVGIDGKPTTDSNNFAWDGGTLFILNKANAITGTAGIVLTGSASTQTRIVSSTHTNSATNGAQIQLSRSRGSVTAPLVPINGTNIGQIVFSGYTGIGYPVTSGIFGMSGGTHSENSNPIYLRITTADANGSSYNTVFTQKGGLSINGTNADTAADLTVNATSLTGSQDIQAMRVLQTWNTSASPTAFFMNITNTSSGASSLLADWRTNNVSVFSVSPIGQLTTASNITSGDNFIAASGGSFTWGGSKSRITSNANGNITLSNNGITGFGILYFGGTTSAFPAIQRQNNVVRFLVSDTSAYAGVQTGQLSVNSAPNASAALTVTSTTQGFLPPVMTATQGSAIASPATGLLIYVTDTNGTFTSTGWYGFNGSVWEKLNN